MSSRTTLIVLSLATLCFGGCYSTQIKTLERDNQDLKTKVAALQAATAQKLGSSCEIKVECDARAGEKCVFGLAEQSGAVAYGGEAKSESHTHYLHAAGTKSIILACNARSAPFRLCCK